MDLCQTELLQRSSKGTDIPPRTFHGFQCMGERLHKRVLPRMQLHIFPPTTTETCINSLLEVITPTREGRKMSLRLVLGRTTNTTRGGPITNQIIPTMEVSPVKSGIPVGSMDLTRSFSEQKGGQHGPQTEK